MTRSLENKRILFVCLGNICRSPTAEAVFRKKLAELKIPAIVDSAGTAGYHVGERSDSRSIRHAEKRGYSMTHITRQFSTSDFERFDLIFVMDDKNFTDVLSLAQKKEHRDKVFQIGRFLTNQDFDHIPDPYYGQAEDFELVITLLEESFENVLSCSEFR